MLKRCTLYIKKTFIRMYFAIFHGRQVFAAVVLFLVGPRDVLCKREPRSSFCSIFRFCKPVRRVNYIQGVYLLSLSIWREFKPFKLRSQNETLRLVTVKILEVIKVFQTTFHLLPPPLNPTHPHPTHPTLSRPLPIPTQSIQILPTLRPPPDSFWLSLSFILNLRK